ncbi:MAG: SPOR domain-containing protein [Proteobacteria bacterium]|nr:SPOR domain-containing protein [Pseudomonadota bacterium]
MLRLALALLLLANAGYYAWSQGLLQGLGLAPASPSEPQRLRQQIDPQNLRLQPAAPPQATPAVPANEAASSTAAAASEPVACLQAGPFDARQAEALRQAAVRLPANSWSLEPVQATRRWMVYMGPFADDDTLARRRSELRAMGVAYDRPGAALEPGLSLGRYSSAEGALRALSQLGAQGVRKARVVQERGDTAGFTLHLPAVDEALRPRLEALQPALAGKPLRPCA